MIKAIIFDLNGVFIQSRMLSERFADDFNIPNGKFVPALKQIMAQVRQPNAKGLFSYWEPYFKSWNLNLDEQGFYDYWFNAEKEIKEMIEVAQKLKNRNFKIFILSNNLRERTKYYEETFSFLKTLPEKIYYSWQTGFIKPDSRAYQLIFDENKLQPEECIYFDDSEQNVEAASSLGVKAFLFKDFISMKNQIENMVGIKD